MSRVHKGRLAMLVLSFVSAVVVTVGLWWHGVNDPFVAGFLIGATLAVWSPFMFHVSEAFHYVEGWTWEFGGYHQRVEYADEPHSVDIYVERNKERNEWHVSLRETLPTVYREVAHWNERNLYSALANGENLAHRILCEARHNNSPF